jgi:hypothetical protein
LRSPGTNHGVRRAKILEVGSPDGTPPFKVRWLDTDREALVFPGVDSYVMTREQIAAFDARMAERVDGVQRHILARRATS